MERSEATDTVELDALERLIRRADDFALAFVRVNAPARRAELVGTLKERLAGDVRIVEVEVPADTTDLQALLARRVVDLGDGKSAVFVYGVERVLSSARERTGLLPVLNYKRENLQRSVPHPVVLWLPEFALQQIADGAPDVWAWRSGVFEFAIQREEADRLWDQIQDGGSVDEYARLMPAERQARIETLEALYHDYTDSDGADEPERTSIRANVADRLGRLYREKPDLDTAREWSKLALMLSERALGPEHPQTLTSVNNLAYLLKTTGDYAAAEPLYRRALDASERVLGPEHPDTLISVNNLAALLESTGDYAAAEPLYRRALSVREHVLGPEHPRTLTSVNNLACLLQSTGDYAAAEPLYRRALDAKERVLGPEHPSTLTSVNNLAGLLETTGDYAAAEPLYRRALDARERVLGPEHPHTVIVRNNLNGLLAAKEEAGG